jgi:hypothetical protein
MGKLDELEEQLLQEKEELERKAALKAGKAAVKTAWKGIVAAVSGAADSVIGAAERELDEARAARGEAPVPDADLEGGIDDYSASTRALDNVRGSVIGSAEANAQPSARERRLAREARARAELAAMKRSLGESSAAEPEPLDEEPVIEARYEGPGAKALRERREREERAKRELEAMKERSVHPDDREPVKRTL